MADIDAPGRFGEIYDRGYQHYLGQRLSRGHAIWALILYSIKRAMGIKKSWTAKVIPIILYLAVIGVVLVLIAIEAFAGSVANTMNYPDYFVLVYLIEGAFVATIAPEMLCGDRRENVLSLYFSRAISRWDYVLSKLAATAILTMTISTIPAVFLWFFRQLLADKPITALTANFDQLLKILLIGTLIAFYLGCGGLVISAFTGRKSIATAIIFVGYAVLEGLIAALMEVVKGDRARNLIILASPSQVMNELANKLFHTYDTQHFNHSGYASAIYVAVAVAVICIGLVIMVWRYVPED